MRTKVRGSETEPADDEEEEEEVKAGGETPGLRNEPCTREANATLKDHGKCL